MNEKKRLIKNTGIIAIGNMSTKLVSFLLLPLYTSVLSTSEYGTVDYITSISVFLVPFISFLMDESMFRFLIDCKTEKEKSKVISTALLIIIIGCVSFLVIVIPILLLIQYQYAVFLVLYVTSSAFSTMNSALLRGIGRTDRYAIYNFSVSVLTVIMNVIFIAVLHLGVAGMLMASIIAHMAIPFLFIISMKLWKYVNMRLLEKSLVIEMIRYSIPLIPNKLSWSIINLSDRLIIMNVLGSDFSGLYAVSYKFPNFMDTVYGFFYQSWKESSARAMHDDNQDSFYNSIYTHLKHFMFSISICMIAFMPLAFKILINEKFSEAIVYVPILLMGTYFSNISGFYGGIFTAYKNTKIMGISTVYAAVINLVVNLALIPFVGLYAAAISTFVANFLVYLYRKAKVKAYVRLSENLKEKFIAIVIFTIVLVLFYFSTTLTIIGACVITVVYALIMNRVMLKGTLKILLFKKAGVKK